MYDRELLSPGNSGQVSQKAHRPIPSPYLPQQAPDVLSDQNSLEAWQRLFEERQSWALQIAEASDAMIAQIGVYTTESDVIKRATTIAAANPRQHIESIQQKYEEAERWVEGIVQEQARLTAQADRSLAASKKITTYRSLAQALSVSGVASVSGKGTLDSVLNKATIEAAKKRSSKTIAMLRQRLEDVQSLYNDVVHDGEDLNKQVESRLQLLSQDVSETINNLVHEMDASMKQVKADCENAMRSSKDPRNVAAISKTALLHTKKFLPSLYDTAIDIGELLRRSAERRNSIEDMASHFLQRTAAVESSLASVQTRMRNIDLEPEDDAALEILGHVGQYPSIYGSLLIEMVRRQEWNQKMLTDTTALAEEMASYRDEEEKRRRKWQKTLDGYLVPDAFTYRTRAIEISVSGQDQSLPALTRDDISIFVHELEIIGGFEETIQQLGDWMKALDLPSKTQPRKANTFRNGALNESTFGKKSLLLRGDDDMLASLQNDKLKLEDRLRGSESRIRKLEDLLHRSNQMARPFVNSGVPQNGTSQAPGMERNRSSPGMGYAVLPRLNDSSSRRSSTASHRLSIVQPQDDDGMSNKVVQLETDLAGERKRLAQFEQSVVKQLEIEDELRRQVDDAVVMKKDLMDNFQTQQQEFDAERKILEEEVGKLRVRLEETEEEYDRVLGSHDNTRGAYSDLIKEHEEIIDNMRADASKELQRAQDKVGNLQTVNDNQHDRLDLLEDEISRNTKAIDKLRQEIGQQRSEQEDSQKVLHSAHRLLDFESEVPMSFTEMVRNLEILSQKAQDQNRSLRLAAETARGENKTFETRFRNREADIVELRRIIAEKGEDILSNKESSLAHEARANALMQELAKERETLKSLSAQVPGSDAIKAQLAGAEHRAETLNLQLATVQALNKHLDGEILKHLTSIESLQTINDIANTRLLDRATRSAEVSLLLYLQTDRLTRLLEHIGFSVSREEDTMVVQRVTRTVSSSNVPTDMMQNMTSSLSGPVPNMTADSAPDYLHWATMDDSTIEKTFFDNFIHESKAFNMDAFCEAVVKRIKDTEHIARKWQREARTYRDRHRSSQFEAQHKIAFRAFKEGDLALFLPTRSQAPQRSWAAFNVGAPHYFLREQEKHRLSSRDWLLARITGVEERSVDLSKSINSRIAAGISDDGQSLDDDNPFGLSDGLRWYYLDAEEERMGAPFAPGPARPTVASAQIDAEGSIQRKKNPDQGVVARVLNKSLDSRRSSGNSRKSLIGVINSPQMPSTSANPEDIAQDTGTENDGGSLKPMASVPKSAIPEEVRRN